MFSKCLCLRTPNLKKIAAYKQKQIEKEIDNDIYEANRVYKEPSVKRDTKHNLKLSSIPRVPLKIRVGQKRFSEGGEQEDFVVRPITQLIGTAKVRTRKQRSVSIWAQ